MGAERDRRKSNNDAASVITDTGMKLVKSVREELNTLTNHQSELENQISRQNMEMVSLWSEYERLYSGCELLTHQLKASGVQPTFTVEIKHRKPTLTKD